jgi:4-hydroxy-4-methyl-2-oxoglutarate aldolase
LVADASASPDRGYWGELLTVAAKTRGLAGVVVDGSVRDIERLVELTFPVFATGLAAQGATKKLPGSVGTPITLGGSQVRTGDWVVGDADGVAVIRADEVSAVLSRAEDKARWERAALVSIRAGQSTIELFDLDAAVIAVTGALTDVP